MYFVRVNRFPTRDLKRGFSYTLGAFGDEAQAHAGLSGYGLWDETPESLREALVLLDHRMGIHVGYHTTLFQGRAVGVGPDGEDLFAPTRIIKTIKVRSIEQAFRVFWDVLREQR